MTALFPQRETWLVEVRADAQQEALRLMPGRVLESEVEQALRERHRAFRGTAWGENCAAGAETR